MGILFNPRSDYDENFEFPAYFYYALVLSGCWPTDGDRNSIWFRLRSNLYTLWNFLCVLCAAFLTVSMFAYCVVNISNLTTVIENLSTFLSAVHLIVRMIHMRFETKRFKLLLGTFAKKIWIKRQSHPKIFDRCITHTNPTFYLSMSLWVAYVIFNTVPIIEILASDKSFALTDKRLPFLMVFPYDEQQPVAYTVTFLILMYAALILITLYYASDTFVALNVNFLIGQYEILHGQIMRLIPECHMEWRKSGNTVANKENIRQLQRMYTQRLHEIVKYHNELIDFSNILAEFLAFPIFINLGTGSLILCCTGFQFVVSDTQTMADLAKFFIYFVTLSGQLYIMCNMGARLISRSTETPIYLFGCNWEGGHISENSSLIVNPDDMEVDDLNSKMPLWQHLEYYPTDLEFQHNLRFMILRSQRPVRLHALKFANLSLESLNRIISSSLSYFALLNSVVNK